MARIRRKLCLQGPTSSEVLFVPNAKNIQTVPGCRTQHGSVTHILYVEKCKHFFAACLDDTLKLYSEQFRLQASFKWHGGIVTSMVYNAEYDELITIGKNGVKAWYCEPDYKAFAKNASAPLNFAPRCKPPQPGVSASFASKLKGGKAPPWELGAFQNLRERVTFR